MNTFKLVLAVCSVVAVTCSRQYAQSGNKPSWDSQNVGRPLVPIKSETGNKYQTPSAPSHTNIHASAFPTITKQICTCSAVSEATAAGMLEKYHHSSSGAAAAQPSASAQQQTAYSQAGQPGTFASTTVAPVQLTHQSHFARPSYASPAKVTGY